MHIHNPLSQFSIKTLFTLSILQKKISFTNLSLFACISCIMFISIFLLLSRGMKVQPTRRQMLLEIVYNVIQSMVGNSIGIKKGKKFIPVIFSLFVFVLLCNFCGMLPFSFAVTSHLSSTIALASVIFFVVFITGIITRGVKFITIFIPTGCPLWLLPLMFIIELFSFLSKPLSIALRLAANITSGHILLHVIVSFIVACYGVKGFMPCIFSSVPLAFSMIIMIFELCMSILQAYIFAVLSCVYLNDVLESH